MTWHPAAQEVYRGGFLACAIVAGGLVLLLLATLFGKDLLFPPWLQPLGAGIGLATYLVWWIAWWHASSGEHGVAVRGPLGLAPCLLLVAAGLAGYLGIS